MPGTDVAYAAPASGVRYCHGACCYALAMRYPVLTQRMVLRACYAMSGTDIAYGATTRGVPTRARSIRVWSVPSPYACATRCPILTSRIVCAIPLRVCYTMSGTDIAHGATCLRVCYAMSGTDIAYGATRVSV
eukprot:834044-Rhodomonas_salina.1